MYTKKEADCIIKEWNKETRKAVRRKSGIYALYLDKICLYVGATNNIESRSCRFFTENRNYENKILCMVVNYCKDNNIKLEVKVYFHDLNNLRNLEFEYIKVLRSRLNTNKPYQTNKVGKTRL